MHLIKQLFLIALLCIGLYGIPAPAANEKTNQEKINGKQNIKKKFCFNIYIYFVINI